MTYDMPLSVMCAVGPACTPFWSPSQWHDLIYIHSRKQLATVATGLLEIAAAVIVLETGRYDGR
jgi:hypothetical protein